MKLLNASIALFLLMTVTFACKKTPSATPLPVYYSISVSGGMFEGDTIQFHCTVPAGKKTLWIFGDGEYTTEQSPKHVFHNGATYYVKIIVDNDSGNIAGLNPSLSLGIRHHFNPSDVQQIAGTRYWRVYQDSLYIPTGDPCGTCYRRRTFADFKDTFAVEVLNSTSVVVKGDTLFLADSSTITDCYSFKAPASDYSWKVLSYYFNKDSIGYSYHPYQGGVTVNGKPPQSYSFGITSTYSSPHQ